ncbi:MAG: type II toxin-antitoxin system Phd/YefM family antitoxin [Caldilinea sp. CFX5]|nr:type II toxin-antitoxin system Phd/YefM family antitoxin [Caldilinea sp. CFX5]
MEKVQQIVPLAHLRTEQDKVLTMMDHAPVILAQHDKPRAVLVSVEQWDAVVERVQELEEILEAKRILERMDADPSSTTTLDELCARFGVVEKPAAT